MLYLFDTSALQHHYISGPKSRKIRRIISNEDNECIISTLSIIEIASTFARHCRSNHLNKAAYRRLENKFWPDIHGRRLLLREVSQREYIKALHLMEYAGVTLGRKITSFDALIAATCLELALERSTPITFCLEDWPLYDVIRRLSAYTSAITLHFIGTMRGQ